MSQKWNLRSKSSSVKNTGWGLLIVCTSIYILPYFFKHFVHRRQIMVYTSCQLQTLLKQKLTRAHINHDNLHSLLSFFLSYHSCITQNFKRPALLIRISISVNQSETEKLNMLYTAYKRQCRSSFALYERSTY